MEDGEHDPSRLCAVLDVGKTHTKLGLIDRAGTIVDTGTRRTPALDGMPYRAFDIDDIERWMLRRLADHPLKERIGHFVPVTHGACAVLVGEDGTPAAPVMDYEWPIPDKLSEAYTALRPAYGTTFSPDLPAGLNLGRQLFAQFRMDPTLKKRVRWILPYPQYWAYRLCGVAAADVTSLGCHTDLWAPEHAQPSPLPRAMGCAAMLPPVRAPWDVLGTISGAAVDRHGLNRDIRVHAGFHDSNAALFPLIARSGTRDDPPAVISTGTWFIVMKPGGDPSALREARDCLANVDALGRPLPTARFMGGRIFERLTAEGPLESDLLSGEDGTGPDTTLMDTTPDTTLDTTLAGAPCIMPNVIPSGGPFMGLPVLDAGLDSLAPQRVRQAASLYLLMLTRVCLHMLDVTGPLLLEGPAARNTVLVRGLAALHPAPVYVAEESRGPMLGAAAAAFYPAVKPDATKKRRIDPAYADAFAAFEQSWQSRFEDRFGVHPLTWPRPAG